MTDFGTKLKWWQDSVDELGIGLAIAAVAIIALIYTSDGVAVATAAISAMGVYLGGKAKNGSK